MAIRLWQPKWYKYWCSGLMIHYSTRWGVTGQGNSILRTHRGYIIPDDANLGVEPNTSWQVTSVVSIATRLLIFIGILVYTSMIGITALMAAITSLAIIGFVTFAMSCDGDLFNIIFGTG